MAIVKRNLLTKISYQVKVRDSAGNWFKTRSYSTLRDAQIEEGRLLELQKAGNKGMARDARVTSYEVYWTVWFVESNQVSDGWKISQKQMYRDYIQPVIGSAMLSEIDTPLIGHVFARMKRKGLSPSTQKLVYTLLNKSFKDAVEYFEILERSPVKSQFHRPKVRYTERSFFKPEQAWMLMKEHENHALGTALWIALLSGMRISEIQALRWEAVDLEERRILIKAAWNKKTRQFQPYPKQSDWGSTTIPEPLYEHLKSRVGKPDDLVCQSETGGVLPYSTFQQGIKKLMVQSGLKELTPHELRHSCTEIWKRAGANSEDLKTLLNHSSLSSTKHYLHSTDDRLGQLGLRVIEGGNFMFPDRVPRWEQKEVYMDDTSKISGRKN